MVEAFICHVGDRWFESGRSRFAEKCDYFMIFEVHSRSGPDRNGGNVLSKFKTWLESAFFLNKSKMDSLKNLQHN